MSLDPHISDDPNAQQRLAADPEASVWVSASAGTGKTKVLTDRVLGLLVTAPELEPQKILCITFTRAAAAEMETRIADRLGRWAMDDDAALTEELEDLLGAEPTPRQMDRARHLFALVLDTPGGMNIQTSHAFCQSLLRRFPLEANIAPHFALLDERDAAEMLLDAEDDLLRLARSDAAAPIAKALADLTLHIGDADRFTGLLANLASARGRLGRLLDGAGGIAPLIARVQALLGVGPNDTRASLAEAASRDDAFDQMGLRLALDALADGSKTDQERATTIGNWLALESRGLDAFEPYANAYLTGERFKGDVAIRKTLITKPAAKKSPGVDAILAEEAARIQRCYQRMQAATVAECTEAMLRIGAALVAGYQRRKARRGLLDYDDLIAEAGQLLQSPGVASWVLYKLDGGIDHILIDEAQDTNPDQWRIVEAIANEYFAGAGTHQTRRTVFAVGDVKQSIYSFQGADPRAFQAMREHFGAQVPAAQETWRDVDLNMSFRSAPAVLRAVDATFGRDTARQGVALDGNPIQHRASRAGAGGLVELWQPVEPLDSDDPPPWKPPVERVQGDVPETRLARLLAARIAKMLGDGELLEAHGRPIRAGDVMVLVRRRTGFVDDLVRALKEASVGVAGVDRMVLTEQIAVMDLMAMARVALLPEDDLNLACVLKSPLLGFTEDDLFQLAYDRKGTLWDALRSRAQGGEAVYTEAFLHLSNVAARADRVQPFEFFSEILSGEMRGREKFLARLGPDAEDPIGEFLNLALQFEAGHVPSLEAFLHWLTSSEVEIKRDLEQGNIDAVRVMTVHGAKGLQAPIVFLPDTMQVPQTSAGLLWPEGEDKQDHALLWPPRRAFYDPVSEAELDKLKAHRDEEYRRLLYVAMTRAEDRLYVCGWRTKNAEPEDCWYHLIRGGLEDIAETVTDPFLQSHGETASADVLRLTSSQTDPVETEIEIPSEPLAPLPDWALAPPAPEPDAPTTLVPSRPDGDEPAAVSPLDGADGSRFLRGNLVHALLQSLPELDEAQRPAAAKAYLARNVHGLDGAAQAAIAGETLAVLADPEFAELFGPGSRAEVPLTGRIGDQIVSGQLDRILVKENEVWVIDFKTNRPPPQTEAQVPEIYIRQMAIYRTALSEIYPGRRVRCVLLWTVQARLMEISESVLEAATP
jgi:ATP-dependent helicase/nuclease subunit A